MRISDWSSDVCSSDLPGAERGVHQPAVHGAVVQRRRIGGDGVDALDQIGLVHGLLGSPVALHPRLLCVRGAPRRPARSNAPRKCERSCLPNPGPPPDPPPLAPRPPITPPLTTPPPLPP